MFDLRDYKWLRRAFTLVELLVVMAALTILAALTLPSLKTLLADQKVTNAGWVVKAHIESARARAVASGRPVAVILERVSASLPTTPAPGLIPVNTVTRMSIGQVFPPYTGDTANVVGTLVDAYGRNTTTLRYDTTVQDGFYDRITVPSAFASLLTAGVVGQGDFIQIGDREQVFVIRSAPTTSGGVTTIDFINPPVYTTAANTEVATQEEQLPVRNNTSVRFRIFRKPEKSFVQSSVLPRGTCVDLTVSGIDDSGNEFRSATTTWTAPIMIVFNEAGRVEYLTDGTSNFPSAVSGVVHLLVGLTDQVSASAPPLEVEDPNDSSTFNANVNDENNLWISINPWSGNVFSSSLRTGSETSTIAARLSVARAFATAGVQHSEN